jgi:hypothetical protein
VAQGPADEPRMPRLRYMGHVSAGFAALGGPPGSSAKCHWCAWTFECDDNSGRKAWEELHAHARECEKAPAP